MKKKEEDAFLKEKNAKKVNINSNFAEFLSIRDTVF